MKKMRKIYQENTLWTTPIEKVKIMKSRHELTYVLRGLIYIIENREDILKLVYEDLTKNKCGQKGRKGMSAVMAITLLVVRNSIKCNYAELEWILHNDKTILAILGNSPENPIQLFDEKTIHQNLNKIRVETIEKINEAVIEGAKGLGYEKGGKIRGDSFVCERNIHFPSESSLLWDCARIIIRNSQRVDKKIIGRQAKHHRRQIKLVVRNIGIIRKSKGKNKEKRIKIAHRILILRMKKIIKKIKKYDKIREEILLIKNGSPDINSSKTIVISSAVVIAEKIMELAQRRIFNEEDIPNNEKILSIFEKEVELINRGKYPISIEFGHKIFLHQSESGFIVDWAIMQRGAKDSEQIKPSIERIKNKYSIVFDSGSYDKGFYTPDNKENLTKLFKKEMVVIPKKGKLNKEETEKESSKLFKKLRFFRARIESLISSLVRGNGMGLCPDKGMKKYKTYIASCILSRNLHTLGKYLLETEDLKLQKAG